MQQDGWSACLWLALRQLVHFAQAPCHRVDHAQTNGRAESFLGTKTRGQIAHAALGPTRAAKLPGSKLGIAQNSFDKALAMARQTGANAAHVANVSANAVIIRRRGYSASS